jgi:hypothetical protein
VESVISDVDLNSSAFYQRVKQRAPIWQRLQKGGMFLAVIGSFGAAYFMLIRARAAHAVPMCAHFARAQVPVSSVCSAAADLETYVMRQSPRISNQLVTLNSRTFDAVDSTLTPVMVTSPLRHVAPAALIARLGFRPRRDPRQHSVRGKCVLR